MLLPEYSDNWPVSLFQFATRILSKINHVMCVAICGALIGNQALSDSCLSLCVETPERVHVHVCMCVCVLVVFRRTILFLSKCRKP